MHRHHKPKFICIRNNKQSEITGHVDGGRTLRIERRRSWSSTSSKCTRHRSQSHSSSRPSLTTSPPPPRRSSAARPFLSAFMYESNCLMTPVTKSGSSEFHRRLAASLLLLWLSSETELRQRQGDCGGNERSEGRLRGKGMESFCFGKWRFGAEALDMEAMFVCESWLCCVLRGCVCVRERERERKERMVNMLCCVGVAKMM